MRSTSSRRWRSSAAIRLPWVCSSSSFAGTKPSTSWRIRKDRERGDPLEGHTEGGPSPELSLLALLSRLLLERKEQDLPRAAPAGARRRLSRRRPRAFCPLCPARPVLLWSALLSRSHGALSALSRGHAGGAGALPAASRSSPKSMLKHSGA